MSQSSSQYSILVVEDDLALCKQMALLLEEINCKPYVCDHADDAIAWVNKRTFDLIILDVMLPEGLSGWNLCRQIRARASTPIVFMTALTGRDNIVRGLDLGADDYLTKPFDPVEFQARIRAHLRRSSNVETAQLMTFGDNELEIDLKNRVVMVRGETIKFTTREFQILEVFVRYPGQVIRTADLLDKAWGDGFQDAKQNIKPYIHYLRKKLEVDPAAPYWVRTVRGIGYRFGP